MNTKEMSPDEVKKIAGLVKLELNPEEITKFQKTIPQTLDTIEILNELDTTGVTPTSQVTGLHNVFKDDTKVKATLTREQALSNANETERGLFVTKAVFDRS